MKEQQDLDRRLIITNETKKVLSNIFRQYGTDLEAEQNGRKFYVDVDNDAYFLIASYKRNKNLARKNAELMKVPQNQRSENDVVEIFINNCVKGWNNICDINGDEIQYSKAKAIEVLTLLPDLVDELVGFAMDSENYRIEAIVKN